MNRWCYLLVETGRWPDMSYPINEDEFVEICMKELGGHDENDEKIAHAVVIALNWAYHKGLDRNVNNG